MVDTFIRCVEHRERGCKNAMSISEVKVDPSTLTNSNKKILFLIFMEKIEYCYLHHQAYGTKRIFKVACRRGFLYQNKVFWTALGYPLILLYCNVVKKVKYNTDLILCNWCGSSNKRIII